MKTLFSPRAPYCQWCKKNLHFAHRHGSEKEIRVHLACGVIFDTIQENTAIRYKTNLWWDTSGLFHDQFFQDPWEQKKHPRQIFLNEKKVTAFVETIKKVQEQMQKVAEIQKYLSNLRELDLRTSWFSPTHTLRAIEKHALLELEYKNAYDACFKAALSLSQDVEAKLVRSSL